MAGSPLFAKLNLKDQQEIFVLNAPDSFEAELGRLHGVSVRRNVSAGSRLAFVLSFVTRQPEVDALAKSLSSKVEGDAVVWFAYPKGSSKRYKSELSRDKSWRALGTAGFVPVRMVAVDEDWTAVRFRRAEFIKTMKRDAVHAMSAAGSPPKRRRPARAPPAPGNRTCTASHAELAKKS